MYFIEFGVILFLIISLIFKIVLKNVIVKGRIFFSVVIFLEVNNFVYICGLFCLRNCRLGGFCYVKGGSKFYMIFC